jgi:hypothetical protein
MSKKDLHFQLDVSVETGTPRKELKKVLTLLAGVSDDMLDAGDTIVIYGAGKPIGTYNLAIKEI